MIHDYGEVIAIDTFMHGWEGITAVYYLPGDHPTVIETGPASSLRATFAGLDEAGVVDLEYIVVTHIHLDHAGAAGQFAERFPDAQVIVREEGAPHLSDPTRLLASASRLYQDMESMWGEVRPVPEDRVRPVGSDEMIVDLGGGRRLDALYTPGHANHHMVVLERRNGDVFAGDGVGVYLPDAGVVRPTTPPPEFDLEVALQSIEKIRSFRPSRVFPTHFGPMPDADKGLDEGAERLRQWVQVAEQVFEQGGDAAAIAAAFRDKREELYPFLDPKLVDKFEQTSSYNLNAAGILRYLAKRQQ